MVYFNSNLISELRALSINDRERIVAALHWAIAENLPKAVIKLQDFRDGEELHVSAYDYSELYNGLSAKQSNT